MEEITDVYKISNTVPRKVFRVNNRIKTGKINGSVTYFLACIFIVRACE